MGSDDIKSREEVDFTAGAHPPLKETPFEEINQARALTQAPKGRNRKVLFSFGEPGKDPQAPVYIAPKKVEAPTRLSTLEKSLQERLNENEFVRLAFEADPQQVGYEVVYQRKPLLIPEWLAKRISHQDDLVAAIVRTRSNQFRPFGVPRPDRHSLGYTLELLPGIKEKLTTPEKVALEARIKRAKNLIQTCGSIEGVEKKDQCTFGDFLALIVQSAIVVGKVAIEKINDKGGEFHSFRAIDAGTIMPATPQKTAGPAIRERAIRLLARLQNKSFGELADRLDLKKWANGDYAWVQVINFTPSMVFTDDQIIVRNFYPVPDVEMCGHPVTPLDTVVSAVTTHISLTTMTKVFFQSGRAAKGMLVIKSDDADQDTIKAMQAHFQANINSASNSYRLPVFAIGPDDEVTWQTIDQQGQRDAEFQYLGDAVARIIMSAFQISPDEMSGWGYLSKGTAAQTLSEGSQEYKIEAARDLGIRPLIRQIEEIVDTEIVPLLDPELPNYCRFRMLGMDAKTEKDEANDLQIAQGLHMTYNETLGMVEKDPIPRMLGGDVPLNPQLHSLVFDKLVPIGWIQEHLMGVKGAATDPDKQWYNNPIWLAVQQMKAQAQQAAQAAAAAPAPGGPPPSGGGGDQSPTPQPAPPDPVEGKVQELSHSLGAAAKSFGKAETGLIDLAKAESQMTPMQKRILHKHDAMVKQFMSHFMVDVEDTTQNILSAIDEALVDGDK